MSRKKIGEILVDRAIISQQTLDQALRKQKHSYHSIGQILADMDMITEEDIAQALSAQFNIPYLKKFSIYQIAKEALDKVDSGTALAKQIFPLKVESTILYLAMANPLDIALQEELSFKLGLQISPIIATPAEIRAAIKIHYLDANWGEWKNMKQTVIHLDAQETILNTTAKVLQQDGFQFYKGSNGVEGLELAMQIRPQLVITDTRLPRLDGKEVFRALRENRETAKIPVIALASPTTAKEEFQLLEMGFFDFIAKPFDPIRLLARARRAVRYATEAA